MSSLHYSQRHEDACHTGEIQAGTRGVHDDLSKRATSDGEIHGPVVRLLPADRYLRCVPYGADCRVGSALSGGVSGGRERGVHVVRLGPIGERHLERSAVEHGLQGVL